MRKLTATICLTIAVLLGRAGVSWSDESNTGPSFDCDKASTPTEYAICASDDLSALDRVLADAYKVAKGLDNSTTLRDEQREWNKEKSSTCGDDVECLSQMYQERIKVLCGDDVECLSHMNGQLRKKQTNKSESATRTVAEMGQQIILDYRSGLMREKLSPSSEYNEYEWELEKVKFANRDTFSLSMQGNTIHGDRVTLRFIPLSSDYQYCDRPLMEVWFSSTNKLSSEYFHENNGIPVDINGTVMHVTVKHIIDHPYSDMQFAVLEFGQPSRDMLENTFSGHTNIHIQIIDGEAYDFETEERSNFLAARWFGVDYNIWSLNGFFEKFDEAQDLCRSMATTLGE
jgi:uncharacterized protein